MKRRDTDIDEIVDTHLGLFRTPPSGEMARAEERALRQLRSRANSVMGASSGESIARPTRWRWPLATVAAAGAIAFVVAVRPALLRLMTGVETQAVVESADGLYRGGGGAIRSGERILFGDIVRTNGGTGAQLRLNDGSRVEMRSQSELSLEAAADGVRIRLLNGSVIVNA